MEREHINFCGQLALAATGSCLSILSGFSPQLSMLYAKKDTPTQSGNLAAQLAPRLTRVLTEERLGKGS